MIISGDAIGGAARAAYRLNRAFKSKSEIDSSMLVRKKMNDDWSVHLPHGGHFSRFSRAFSSIVDSIPLRLQRSTQIAPRSSGLGSIIKSNQINATDADVINLHWIGAGFLSIEEIGKITKPVVWTLHDMWPFCGSEHLASDDQHSRWRTGYSKKNRNPLDGLLDVDRWVWLRKQRAWKIPMHIVTPSRWLAKCVKSSEIMHDWDVTIIPNTLDINVFKPAPRFLARQILNLPVDAKLILFGAIGGTQLSHKGWDLLKPALINIGAEISNVQAVILGQSEPINPLSCGMPLNWMGHLHDDATLALLFSAVDVVVIPSRQENLPQIGTEAHSCGCPVVGFNVSGLSDVVEHGVTGYLAEPYSSNDLAKGVMWVIEDDGRRARLAEMARERSVRLWSHEAVIPQYAEVYRQAILKKGH